MIAVLSVLVVVGILAGVVGSHASLHLHTSTLSAERDRAHYAAYGGLQRSLNALEANSSWTGVSGASLPGIQAVTYDVTAYSNLTGATPMPTPFGLDVPPGAVLLHSLARCDSGSTNELLGLVVPSSCGQFQYAAAITESLKVDGAVIDAYDSSVGDYILDPTSHRPGEAHVASSKPTGVPVLVNENASRPSVIDGKVACHSTDPSTVYTTTGASSVTGGYDQLSAQIQLPAPPAATFLGGPSPSANGGVLNLVPGHYGALTATLDAKVYLAPGDYYFDEPVVFNDASELILTGGKVRIFFDTSFKANQQTKLNPHGIPADLEIMGVGPSTAFELHDSSKGWAVAYGDDMDAFFCGDLYGAIAGKNVEASAGGDATGNIHYDVALGQGSSLSGVGGSGYTFASIWSP